MIPPHHELLVENGRPTTSPSTVDLGNTTPSGKGKSQNAFLSMRYIRQYDQVSSFLNSQQVQMCSSYQFALPLTLYFTCVGYYIILNYFNAEREKSERREGRKKIEILQHLAAERLQSNFSAGVTKTFQTQPPPAPTTPQPHLLLPIPNILLSRPQNSPSTPGSLPMSHLCSHYPPAW